MNVIDWPKGREYRGHSFGLSWYAMVWRFLWSLPCHFAWAVAFICAAMMFGSIKKAVRFMRDDLYP